MERFNLLGKARLNHLNALFKEQEIYHRKPSMRAQAGLIIALSAIFAVLIYFLPGKESLGFDWNHFFGIGYTPPYYPPWVKWVVSSLTYPSLTGLTLAAVFLATFKRSVHIISAVCALLTLPLFWTLFLGQLDGLVVLGLLGMPWLAPLALMKPQVSLFAFGARRSYWVALVVVLLLSFAVWGFWPVESPSVWQVHTEGRFPNDIAIGLMGLPIALFFLWLSRGDMDMLMLSGIFATPYLLPYNLLPIMPAIARLRPLNAFIACLLTWLPLTANWFGPSGWWLGWLSVSWILFCLTLDRYMPIPWIRRAWVNRLAEGN